MPTKNDLRKIQQLSKNDKQIFYAQKLKIDQFSLDSPKTNTAVHRLWNLWLKQVSNLRVKYSNRHFLLNLCLDGRPVFRTLPLEVHGGSCGQPKNE